METEIEIKNELDEGKRKSELLTLEQKTKISKVEDENDLNTRKKPGRKRLELSESKSKKEKNRVAQRAWRERKEKYVLELEAKISELEKAKNKTESEKQQLQLVIEKLKSENIYLKTTSFIFTPNEETKKFINQNKLNIQNQITNNTFNNTFTQNGIQSNPLSNINNLEHFGSNSLYRPIHPNTKIQNSINDKNILNNPLLNNTNSLQIENIYSKNNINNSTSLNHQEPTPPMNTNDYGLEIMNENNNVMLDELFSTINYNVNNQTLSTPINSSLASSFINNNSNNVMTSSFQSSMNNNSQSMVKDNNNNKTDLMNNIYLSLIEQNLKQNQLSSVQPNSFPANQEIFNTQGLNLNNGNMLINNELNSTTTLPFLMTSSNDNSNLGVTTTLPITTADISKLANELTSTNSTNSIDNNNKSLDMLINSTSSNVNAFNSILPLSTTTTTSTTNSINNNPIANANANININSTLLTAQNDFTKYKSLSAATATKEGTSLLNNDVALQLSTQPPLLDSTLLNFTNNVPNVFNSNISNVQGLTDEISKNQNIHSLFNDSSNNTYSNPLFTNYRDNTSISNNNNNIISNSNIISENDQNENIQLMSDDLFNKMIQQMHRESEEINSDDDEDEFDPMKRINEMSAMKDNNNAYMETPITPELSLKESSPEIEEQKQQQQQQQQGIATPESTTTENEINQVSSPSPIKEDSNTTPTINIEKTESNESTTASTSNKQQETNSNNKKTSISTLQFPEKQKPTKLNIPYAVFPKVSQDTVDSFINDAKLTDEELDCLCFELKKKATCKEKLKYIQTNMSIDGWSIEKWQKGRIKKNVATTSS